ncbi:MAG TPA: hypothetical protein VEB63_03795 [Chitinophagaceae bacterium]|nr:hypothetical protein [Chitinophagaceae bacterium]
MGIHLCFIVASVCLLSCNGAAQNCANVKLTPSDLVKKKTKYVLFLIADDRSGSTSNPGQPARLNVDQYNALVQEFLNRGYSGQFAVRIIGNTQNSGFETALEFERGFKEIPVDEHKRLSEKAVIRCKNQLIRDTNQKILSRKNHAVRTFMSNVVQNRVLNYRPNGPDRTDIYTALRDIELKMNIGASFDKIIVVIFSDGVDSNRRPLQLNSGQKPFDLVLIGWPPNRQLKQGEVRLGSADDLVTWFQNLNL